MRLVGWGPRGLFGGHENGIWWEKTHFNTLNTGRRVVHPPVDYRRETCPIREYRASKVPADQSALLWSPVGSKYTPISQPQIRGHP